MGDYLVSYCLRDFHHSYIVSADSEYRAIEKVLKTIPETSRPLLNHFKIAKYVQPWN